MANNTLNISIPVKFEIKTPPRGMTDYDPKALSADQQKELNTDKLNVRKEDVMYLSEHPEVKAITTMVIRMTIIHQPRNIIEFVAKLFTRPEHQIREEINKILRESLMEFKPIPYDDYEKWDY